MTKAYLKKIRKISNKQPNLSSKGIRKGRTNKAQSQQKEGIIKIRVQIETFLKKEKINETKRCFFKKINKIEKTLAKLIEKKREIKETRNEGGEITTNITEIQTIISEQYKQRKTIE